LEYTGLMDKIDVYSHGNLTPRQQDLLRFVIKEFINSAKPVASATIHRKAHLHVSPATIRAELSHLEDRGFLSQLHTSGARVPTDKAYRHFVNSLNLQQSPEPAVNDKRAIRTALADAGQNPRQINKAVADTLSKLTANLVITGTEEQNDFFKFGLSNLMNLPEFREFDRMFQLTNFFEEFDRMFDLLERQLFGPAFAKASAGNANFKIIQVSIGRENPVSGIKEDSVIATRYPLPNGYIGSLTLIGPTRMDYEKNIALIKFTKEELNKRIPNI